MFSKNEAEDALRTFIGAPLDKLDVVDCLSFQVDFYASSPASGAVPDDEDGDTLLWEWGTFDWGTGPAFNLSLRRQIIYPDGDSDQEIWQLGVIYQYDPRPVLSALGDGEEWCFAKTSAEAFRASMLASPVVSTCKSIAFRSVDVTWEAQ